MDKHAGAKPAQHQDQQPGLESEMRPKPKSEDHEYVGSSKLKGKVALITGGDSGIGKAIAIAFAKEGADVAIVYLNEDEDAIATENRIKELGRKCLLLKGDIKDELFCMDCIKKIFYYYDKLDILINNAAEQYTAEDVGGISTKKIEDTFRTNIFSMFYFVRAALPYLSNGGIIINTTSVTAYRGSKHLLYYSATKGAIVSFTRSLSLALADKNIRVNGVAPGPVWTPLIPASFSSEEIKTFGAKVPMKRPAEPYEIAPCYVFLASKDSSYMSGQILHPNGGEIIGG